MQPIRLLEDKDPNLESKIELAVKNLISLNHSAEYIAEVRKKCENLEEGYGLFENVNDIYYSKDSFLGAILCVEAIY